MYHSISVLLYAGVDQEHQSVGAVKGTFSDPDLCWDRSGLPDEHHHMDREKYLKCGSDRACDHFPAGDEKGIRRKNFIASFFSIGFSKNETAKFSDRTINELVKACYEMGKVKTGALIVVEDEIVLAEYERTGIAVDGILTSQLLINIFEKNTPLHDGAVIVRGDRVVSATCYLPLTDSLSISKDLGTRHRAAVGISEVSDSLTIVVSEETGKVSIAIGGELYRNVDADFLRNKLMYIQKREKKVSKIESWKRRLKDVKETRKQDIQ